MRPSLKALLFVPVAFIVGDGGRLPPPASAYQLIDECKATVSIEKAILIDPDSPCGDPDHPGQWKVQGTVEVSVTCGVGDTASCDDCGSVDDVDCPD